MKSLSEAVETLAEHEFNLPQFLREQGVRGTRSTPYGCPIARYLVWQTGDVVTVGPGVARSFTETVPLPFSVSMFTTDFDLGMYPDLEQE